MTIQILLKKYQEAYKDLVYKEWQYTFGEGTVIGFFAALCHKMLFNNDDKYNKQIAVAAILGVLGAILHRFKTAALFPHFNEDLRCHDNFMDNARLRWGFLLSLVGATVSYCSACCAINRIAGS